MNFFENFNFSNLFSKKKIDEDLLNKFEELLIESDVGTQIASDLKEKLKTKKKYLIFLVNKYQKYLSLTKKNLIHFIRIHLL